MNPVISPKTRTLFVQSLPAVEARRDQLRVALAKGLSRTEQDPELSDTPDVIATLLLGFTIEQVKHVIESGAPRNLPLHRTEHRLHGVDGRHYSRFGDVLVPVLRDTLGPSYPWATASAWSDAFWTVLQRMQQDDPAPARSQPAPVLQPVA